MSKSLWLLDCEQRHLQGKYSAELTLVERRSQHSVAIIILVGVLSLPPV